jgi:serine/threonine protein kinase
MIRLRSPYIVTCYGLSGNGSVIVMERMTHGSLCTRIESTPHLLSSLEDKLQVAVDIIHGIEFLHHQGVVHADLKSPNVLLTDIGNGALKAKLADFGLSHVLWCGDETTSPLLGMSIRWAAPELLVPATAHQSKAADMYAYGVILWELLALQKPLKAFSGPELARQVLVGERDEIPSSASPQMRDLVTQCWSMDQSRRLSAATVRHVLLQYCDVIRGSKGETGGNSFQSSSGGADQSDPKCQSHNSVTL